MNQHIPTEQGPDWKGLGYIVSIFSVFLLGAIAWPTPQEPDWHKPVLIGGMLTSIIGMGMRYLAHIKQQKKIAKVDAKAER
jgi:hypothetical protein